MVEYVDKEGPVFCWVLGSYLVLVEWVVEAQITNISLI